MAAGKRNLDSFKISNTNEHKNLRNSEKWEQRQIKRAKPDENASLYKAITTITLICYPSS